MTKIIYFFILFSIFYYCRTDDVNECLKIDAKNYRSTCKKHFVVYIILLLNRDDPDVAFEHVKKIQPMLEPCIRLEDGKNETTWSDIQLVSNETLTNKNCSYFTFPDVYSWTEFPNTTNPLYTPFTNFHWGTNDNGLMKLLSDTQSMHNRCQEKSDRQPVFFILTDMNSTTASDKFKYLPDRVTNDVLRNYSSSDILIRIIWTKENKKSFNVVVLNFMNDIKSNSTGYVDWDVDDLTNSKNVAEIYGMCPSEPVDSPMKQSLEAGIWIAIGLGALLIIFMIVLIILLIIFSTTSLLNRPAYLVLRFLERRFKFRFNFLIKLHRDLADEGLDHYVQEYNKGEDAWEINPKNLHISSEKIGSGAFAAVFKGILVGVPPIVRLIPQAQLIGGYARDENAVAVKRPHEHLGAEERIDFLQEIRFMKTLDFHPHVLTMLGCYIYPLQPLIITELCELGDLLSLVRELGDPKTKEHSPIDTDILPVITWQICDALAYLSTKNIIHRDVAARNVLITSGKVAKLSDFGLCRNADDLMYNSKKTTKLPLKWMAPESIEKAEYSHKSDMWSYGILLYEVFSFGTVPYPTIASEAVLAFVKKGNRPEIPDETPSYIEPMMHQCWRLKPSERPNAADLKFSLYTQIEARITGDGYLQVNHYDEVADDGMPGLAQIAEPEYEIADEPHELSYG